MTHPIYRVIAFDFVGPFTLRVQFDDGVIQTINFRPVLEGEIYGPLQDENFFRQVEIDPDAHTLVWPNGADFDPGILHDWPTYFEDFQAMAKRWASATTHVA
jgi:hypothetical protein